MASGWRLKVRSAGAACIAGGACCNFWNWLTGRKRWASRRTWRTLLFTLGYNAPEDRILPADFEWGQTERFQTALRELTAALRPWIIDFHVAQNDATVHGSGSHDKTGHHCLPDDPNGKLDIVRDAGHWLRDEHGQLTKSMRHICWD